MITDGAVVEGSSLTFTAQAAEGYRITKWIISKNGVEETVSVDEITGYESIDVIADAELSVRVLRSRHRLKVLI